jgi:hypothetical protein
MNQPSIGRAVHYVVPPRGSAEFAIEKGHLPATVVSVEDDGTLCLTVCRKHGPPVPVDRVRQSTEMVPGTWHWPEKIQGE